MQMIHEGALPNRRGFSIQVFRERFLEICEEHRAHGRAWAFAFLFYDFTSPQIRKILEDNHYWDALDQLSGSDLTIFSFHSPPHWPWPHTAQTHVNGMFSVRDVDDGERGSVWNYFDPAKIHPPCVVFFQVVAGEITDTLAVPLVQNRTEDAYLELRTILKTVVDRLAKIKADNEPAPESIFDRIRVAVGDYGEHRIIRAIVGRLPGVRFVLKLLADLTGNQF